MKLIKISFNYMQCDVNQFITIYFLYILGH